MNSETQNSADWWTQYKQESPVDSHAPAPEPSGGDNLYGVTWQDSRSTWTSATQVRSTENGDEH